MRKKKLFFLKKALNNKILIAILIVAATLRFIGTNPGHNQFHSDEGISYSAAASMVVNNNLDPLRYDYPAIVPLTNYIFFQTIFIPISWSNYFLKNSDQYISGKLPFPLNAKQTKKILKSEILGYRDINALFWGRYVTALFSLGNVFLLYLLATKLFNKQVGLIAALLLAFNFKHIQNSHIGLPDIYNAFFLLLSLLFSIRLLEKRRIKDFLFAGLGAGLFFSTKYQFFAFPPILLIHLYNSLNKGRIVIPKLLNPKIILVFIAAGAAFFTTNLYFFIHLKKALEVVQFVSLKYAMGRNQLNLYPLNFFLNVDYGPLQMLAILFGIIYGIYKYRRSSILLLSVLLPALFILMYYSIGGFYVRNFITLTPLLLIFAALAFWEFSLILTKKFGEILGKLFFVTVLFFALIFPGKNALIHSYYYTKPWGYDELRKWENQNLPKDAIVASHPFDPVPEQNKRTLFEIDGNYSLAEHKEVGATYALMNLDWAGNAFYFWMNFGFDKVHLILNKPIDLMRNTFAGLAAEEIFRYQVYSITKPWQAPDSGLILARIPTWPEIETDTLRTFNFNNDLEKWRVYNKDNKFSADFIFDPNEGKTNKGSINFTTGSLDQMLRITSDPIGVKPGYLYIISAAMKSDVILKSKERDGFLRVDFYQERNNLEKVGVISSVSSRIYKTNQWLEKEIIERAPDQAKFLTVSFQVGNGSQTKFWIDDVLIEESKTEVSDITSKEPYIKKEIQLDLLYPNSHGNL